MTTHTTERPYPTEPPSSLPGEALSRASPRQIPRGVPWEVLGPALATMVLAMGLLAGCRSAQETGSIGDPSKILSQVEVGMGISEVHAQIGPPVETIRKGKKTRWLTYGTKEKKGLIYVRDDTVAAVPTR